MKRSREFRSGSNRRIAVQQTQSVPFCTLAAHIKPQCKRPKQAPQRTASFASRLLRVPQNPRQVDQGEQQHAVPRIYVHGIVKNLFLDFACASEPFTRRLPCGKRVRWSSWGEDAQSTWRGPMLSVCPGRVNTKFCDRNCAAFADTAGLLIRVPQKPVGFLSAL